MAEEIPPKAEGEPKAEPAVENLPPRTDVAPAASVPVGESAAEIAAKHGGRVTARPRKPRADGLEHESPEAIKKDRDGEAQRKRESRAAKAAILGKTSNQRPAPIPSALPTVDAALPVSGNPADLLDSARIALVLWTGTDLEPVCADIVAALEEFRDYMRERKIKLAQLPPAVVAELTKDSAWGERTKKVLFESGARIIAKLLNKTKISAEHKDEVIFAGAALMVIVGEFRFHSKLELLIAENKKNPLQKAA
jgi:hypothetical protein